MKLRPDKDKDAGGGLILPGRELEGIASAPDEFPSWYPKCSDCAHVEYPPGGALILTTPAAFWGTARCGKFRDPDTGKPVRSCWYERYGMAPSFNDITAQPEGPVKIGRCGPKAEYFEKRKLSGS